MPDKKNLQYLDRCFEINKPSKTLKIKLKDGYTYNEGVTDAARYLAQGNEEDYTRVEFKYGNLYFVVARLK